MGSLKFMINMWIVTVFSVPAQNERQFIINVTVSATVVLLVDSQNNSSDSENKSLQKHKFTSAYLYYIILGVGSR